MSTIRTIESKEQAIQQALEFYKGRNIPNNATEYQKDHPPGMGRTALRSVLGLTFSQFISLINKEYIKPNSNITIDSITEKAESLDFKVSNAVIGNANTTSIELQCIHCSKVQTKSYKSLLACTLGCVFCKAKNIPVYLNPERLFNPLKRVNATLISSIPKRQTEFIKLKCNNCETEYRTQLVSLISPNSPLKATCPNCRKSDTRIVYNNITFGSSFEKECYIILEKAFGSKLRTQVTYRELIGSNRRWVADFVLENTVIEVSSFKVDYRGYFNNLKDKQEAVLIDGRFSFEFLDSIRSVEEFIIRYSLNI